MHLSHITASAKSRDDTKSKVAGEREKPYITYLFHLPTLVHVYDEHKTNFQEFKENITSLELIMTPEPKEIGHQARFGKGLIALFKRGCWEIPEIMGASGMALIGIGLGVLGCYNYVQSNGDNKEYKSTYMVVRSDDPRAKKMINPVCTQYSC